MALDTNIRDISRDKLFEIFKTPEAVRLIETLLYAVRTALPTDTSGVQANLDAHIASLTGAHQANAIGFTPAGGIASADVQGAIVELDTEKQPRDGMLTALSALVTVADRLLYFTGPDAPAQAVLTAFARTLLDDVNASDARLTLGVGSLATQAASSVAITGGDIGLQSGSLGYATGNGGTVAQATNKSTGVTLNKICGEITLHAAALAAGTAVVFTLTDSTIAAGDRIVINHVSGGTFGAYHVDGRCAAGSADIVVRNLTAGSLSEAIVLGFTVVKSATA